MYRAAAETAENGMARIARRYMDAGASLIRDSEFKYSM